jgi:uncharacterized membrane protein YcaP (DUF421 family)
MNYLIATDWARLFRPEMSLLEILIRGTLVYVTLCVLLRFLLKRQAGRISLPDLLVVSVIAGVARNPLVKDAYSIPDGLAVVAVVISWSYALDWLCYYSPLVHKLFHPNPVVLIQDGRILKENLRRELITESQLLSQLRQHGLDDPAEVAKAVLEGSGHVSVIRKENPCGQPANGCQPNRTPKDAARLLAQPDTSWSSEEAAFLRATARLREVIDWHEQRIAELRQALTEAQSVLAANGVRRAINDQGRPA